MPDKILSARELTERVLPDEIQFEVKKDTDITPEFNEDGTDDNINADTDNGDNDDNNTDDDNTNRADEGDSSDSPNNSNTGDDPDDSDDNTEGTKTDTKSKKKGKAQKRIEKLARDKNYWKDRAMAAEQQQVTPPEPKLESDNKAPVVDDFEDYEDYQKALVDYRVDKALTKQNQKTYTSSETQRKNVQLEDHLARGAEKYEDFEEVISDETLPITQSMLDVMVDCDHMPDILYFLANNPDELSKISRQSKVKQTLFFGRLDNGFATKIKTKTKTKAKAPIKTVKSNAAPAANINEMSYDDYRKHRLQQMEGK